MGKVEQRKKYDDPGSIDPLGSIYDAILQLYAQEPYVEERYEDIPRAPHGGDPLPFEAMSQNQIDDRILDVIEDDLPPMQPWERTKWLNDVFGK